MLKEENASFLPLRRRFLALAGVGCIASTGFWAEGSASAQLTLETLSTHAIKQPNARTPKAFIERAFEMRQLAIDHGDQAYGAVVIRENQIIGQSWSRVIIDNDPTGHAEMSALRDAARRTEQTHLSGATLYSTSHPCNMCEAAASWVGIVSMVHGAQVLDAGAPHTCSG